jgi:ATP synthase mitochondrial F1 complex assembly factor 1
LLNVHGAPKVREIWTEYHRHHASSIADVLTAEEYGILMQRSKRCPLFVLPVPRKGGYFTVITQFQGRHCLLTYLEDYKVNRENAVPYATLTLFDELVEKKGLALIRGEITNNMTREEGRT